MHWSLGGLLLPVGPLVSHFRILFCVMCIFFLLVWIVVEVFFGVISLNLDFSWVDTNCVTSATIQVWLVVGERWNGWLWRQRSFSAAGADSSRQWREQIRRISSSGGACLAGRCRRYSGGFRCISRWTSCRRLHETISCWSTSTSSACTATFCQRFKIMNFCALLSYCRF